MRSVARLNLLGLLAGISIACGDASSPDVFEPGSITLGDAAGFWEFDVQRNAACFGGRGDIKLFVNLGLDGRDPSLSDGVANFDDLWEIVDPPRFEWTVMGNVNLETGRVELRLWLRINEIGSELTGTMTKNGSFRGSLLDPIPGFSPDFVIGSCTFEVTGFKRS